MGTQLTIADIVRAALEEFAGAGGVSDEDIADFLAKQGGADIITGITILVAERAEHIKRRLLAGQSVGEAYEKENHD